MNTTNITSQNMLILLLKYQLFLKKIEEKQLPISVLVNRLASDLEGLGVNDISTLTLALRLMPPDPEFLKSENLTFDQYIDKELEEINKIGD